METSNGVTNMSWCCSALLVESQATEVGVLAVLPRASPASSPSASGTMDHCGTDVTASAKPLGVTFTDTTVSPATARRWSTSPHCSM